MSQSSRYRPLPPVVRWASIASSFAAIAVAVIYLFGFGIRWWGGLVASTGYFNLMLALLLPLVFLYFPATNAHRRVLPWYDIVFAVFCFAAPFYFFLRSMNIMTEGWEAAPPVPAFIAALVFWALTLEALRRTVGNVVLFIVVAFAVYPLFASHMPGILLAKSYPLDRLAGYYVFGPEGLIGIPIRVLANLIIGFMLFSIVLIATGAGNFFRDVSFSMLGGVRGGTAKVCVISSALIGTISGSVIANILTAGSFTIPAMKRTGYPAHYAGGIEACASTGGVLMPPVMGAVAFILASFLNISYATVCLAAAVPSVLYYLGLFIQVDGYAARRGMKGLPKEELPRLRSTLKDGWLYLIAFAVLLYVLFALRREAQAPFFATLALLAMAMLRKKTRLGPKDFIKLVEDSGRTLGEIAGILAPIGLIVGSLFITGVAQGLAGDLIELAQGNIVVLVIISAIVCYVLGMGVTLTAVYVLAAVLLAPALIRGGLDPLAVHLFLMYCAMLSSITPPVAIGAFAAAAVAGADPIKTAFQACRLGSVLFLVPFVFVFNPALIFRGSPLATIEGVATATVGVVLLGSGIEGYLMGVGSLNRWGRILSLASGLLLFIPNWICEIAGAAILVLLLLLRPRVTPATGKARLGVE